tara:strand:+ start:4811 stop:5467 length:657 start_codon:yes stop_codon:yes gene_type:complete
MYIKKKGLFIVLEGVDGSGKTFHGKKLYLRLKKNNLPVEYTREPGGTKTSESIRKIILHNKKINRYTETFLYFACRSEHLEKKIYPCLKKNKIVICDRFLDSTLAYQGAGFGIDKRAILIMQQLIAKKLKPDLTILLKLNAKNIKTRLINRRSNNKYDFLPKKFYKMVNNAFSILSKKAGYLIVNSSMSRGVNERIIFDKVIKIIKKRYGIRKKFKFQ